MIPPKLRFLIIRRDSGRCLVCGRNGEEVPLHVDHVFAKSLGGTDDPANLATLCRDCNLGKGVEQIDHGPLRERILSALRLPLPNTQIPNKPIRTVEHGSPSETILFGSLTFQRGNKIHIIPDSEYWKKKFNLSDGPEGVEIDA